MIDENTIEIYSKDNCQFCVKAKILLEQNNLSYTEIDAVEKREDLIKRVIQITGRPPRTVPQIFIGDQYIGGYDDLVAHFAK